MNAPRNQLLVGDVRDILPTIPDTSVDCVITSPPYFRLRNYGSKNQIGLEGSVDAWVDELGVVLRGLARVLKPSGTLWLNLGDSFSRHDNVGAPPKSLLLGPERLALAMVNDGWIIRSKVIWAKTNPMPASVQDRLTCTYELIYFATRSRHYFFDLDAIRVPHRSTLKGPSPKAARRATRATRPRWSGPLAGTNRGLDGLKAQGLSGHPLGKNPGDVWSFPTSNHRGAHHAMFPVDLITRPLVATCPERVCRHCGVPWARGRHRRTRSSSPVQELRAGCACDAKTRPGLVLDPFLGAGTVAVAAEQHHRDWLGIELQPDFAQLARERIECQRAGRGSNDEIPAARAA